MQTETTKLSKLAVRRLTKLADFLEKKVQDAWFNLGTWAGSGFTEKKCGTTACAAGWATVCFPRSGLELEPWIGHAGTMLLTFGDEFGFSAVTKFFDLERDDAEHIFDPEMYEDEDEDDGDEPTREDVIDRIREFVVQNG